MGDISRGMFMSRLSTMQRTSQRPSTLNMITRLSQRPQSDRLGPMSVAEETPTVTSSLLGRLGGFARRSIDALNPARSGSKDVVASQDSSNAESCDQHQVPPFGGVAGGSHCDSFSDGSTMASDGDHCCSLGAPMRESDDGAECPDVPILHSAEATDEVVPYQDSENGNASQHTRTSNTARVAALRAASGTIKVGAKPAAATRKASGENSPAAGSRSPPVARSSPGMRSPSQSRAATGSAVSANSLASKLQQQVATEVVVAKVVEVPLDTDQPASSKALNGNFVKTIKAHAGRGKPLRRESG